MKAMEITAYTLLGLLALSVIWLVVEHVIQLIRVWNTALGDQHPPQNVTPDEQPDFASMSDREYEWWIEKQLMAQDEAEGYRYDATEDYWANDHVTCWDDVPDVIASDCAEAGTKPSASLRAGVSVQKGGVQ